MFPRMKSRPLGCRSQNVPKIHEQVLTLRAIPKIQFQRWLDQWQKRQTLCIS